MELIQKTLRIQVYVLRIQELYLQSYDFGDGMKGPSILRVLSGAEVPQHRRDWRTFCLAFRKCWEEPIDLFNMSQPETKGEAKKPFFGKKN